MFLTLAVSAAVAVLMSLAVCAVLLRDGPVDNPGGPLKTHTAPTPTSGGLGIALGVAGGLVALSITTALGNQAISAEGAALVTTVIAFAFIFLLVGFLDDARPVSARFKFVLFVAVSIAAAVTIGTVDFFPLTVAFVLDIGPWFGLFGTTLWVFTLVNCVNFMDGAHGLAIGSVTIGLLVLGVLSLSAGALTGAALGFCGAGAMIGFLVFNYPSGRLFAGDAGSLFGGAIAALGSLLVIHRTGLSPFVPAILFFPLLADTLLTLAWRAGRGRSLLDGHSEHLYQIALRDGWSHARIAAAYWGAAAACGVIGFIVAGLGAPSTWLALAGLSVIAIFVSFNVRRYALERGIAEN